MTMYGCHKVTCYCKPLLLASTHITVAMPKRYSRCLLKSVKFVVLPSQYFRIPDTVGATIILRMECSFMRDHIT